MAKSRRAFSLVELLVSIAIIGLLIALLMPAIQMAREAARRVACQNNLHQIGIAIHNYHETNRYFPSGWIADAPEGAPGWGWAAMILPHLEQGNLNDLIDYGIHIEAGANDTARVAQLPIYFCPSDDAERIGRFALKAPSDSNSLDTKHLPLQMACTNYVAVYGAQSIEKPT